MAPREFARLKRIGVTLPDDMRALPEKAIAERAALTGDYPDFAPAYDAIAVDYALLGDMGASHRYRALAAAARKRAGDSGG